MTTESTIAGASPVSSTTMSPGAYCDEVVALAGERPETYVGSEEHRGDTQRLLDVAPEAVFEPLRTFSSFVASGAIDPGDPNSNLVENWPLAVQEAIGEILAYNDTAC